MGLHPADVLFYDTQRELGALRKRGMKGLLSATILYSPSLLTAVPVSSDMSQGTERLSNALRMSHIDRRHPQMGRRWLEEPQKILCLRLFPTACPPCWLLRNCSGRVPLRRVWVVREDA
jgi:hypothetical protein